ncbi:hypothetical protein DdX_17378 [Ditylenchus destructor]|uniref:Uncharacterized protein n=1 Tax=Ditylenchus destructor TaxID=166010 RepID=A0AAD4MMA2_9BILA|nr:hypothetical protein DdX_17378 [Ditylenchus destructor]
MGSLFILLLLTSVNITDELAKVKREYSDSLEEADIRIAEMKKKEEDMAEKLKSWEHLHRFNFEYGDAIRKETAESKCKESLQELSPLRLDPIMLPAAGKRQNQDSGSNGDSAKKARIDPKKPEEAGAKNAANVA